MHERRLFLTGVGVLGVFAAGARATDYYVRISGSDLNAGTSAGGAFRTIDRAADVAHAGDTIYVGAGTYAETITPTNDGTEDAPIRFVADTSGAKTGDAGAVVISGGACLSISSDDYFEFVGFTIQSSGSATAVDVQGSAGFRLENCTVIGGGTGVRNRNGADATLSGCVIQGSSDSGVRCDTGQVVIESSTIESSGDQNVWVGGAGTAEVRVTGSRLLGGGSHGVRFGAGTLTMVNSVLVGTTSDGILSGSNNNTLYLYNCTIGNIGDDALDWRGTGVVRNCIFFSVADDALARRSGSLTASHILFDDVGGDVANGVTPSETLTGQAMFEDEAELDLRLTVGSPAIDEGMDGSAWASDDLTGGERPAGQAWDLGAYEYGASVYYASIPYETDFESGAGEEWINAQTETNGTLGQFAGRYYRSGSGSLLPSLNVSGTPGETYYLFFDFYAIDSWDGDNTTYGPDRLFVDVDGVRLFDHSYSYRDDFPDDNPFPMESQGNYGFSYWPEEVYRRVYVRFTPAASLTTIEFSTTQMQGLSDESFGLDNVMVLSEEDAQAYLGVFVDVSEATGFDVENDSANNTGSGQLWGDIDRDGDLDVVITGLDARLMRYDAGTGTYDAQTLGSGGNVRRQGALLDVDRDGDLDFWSVNVSSYNTERLFAMTGGTTMTDVGSAGFSGPSNNEGVGAGDVDADGLTDLVMFSENGNWIGINTGEDPVRFEATSESADGLTGFGRNGNGEYVSGADVNNDGYPDFLYHYGGGRLFQSRGDGTYIADQRGIAIRTGEDDKSGSAWGDYDNDGDMDLFSPSFRPGEAGFLYRNVGISGVYDAVSGEDVPLALFVNASAEGGIDSTAKQRSAAWGDYDNDGDLDLLVTTDADDPLLLYQNQGDGTFERVEEGAGISGDLHDAVFVDYDNDGDLDIAASRAGGTNVLLENTTDGTAYLKVRAVRPGENEVAVDVIGARIELWTADGSAILARRDVGVARGYGGIEPVWAHFGGVDPSGTYTLRVVWPGGDEVTREVTPGSVSTTIGGTTIAQMVTIVQEDRGRPRVLEWHEVSVVDE